MTNSSSCKKNEQRRGNAYKPTPFMAKDSTYDKTLADHAVAFIQCLNHTKGVWAGKPFLRLVAARIFTRRFSEGHIRTMSAATSNTIEACWRSAAHP